MFSVRHSYRHIAVEESGQTSGIVTRDTGVLRVMTNPLQTIVRLLIVIWGL
jgi:hypothetical protein